MSWLRRILGRSRRDKIRNEVTREELGQRETVVDKIRKRRLTWFGHVTRMDDKRLPAAALLRTCGGNTKPRKTNKDLDGQYKGGSEGTKHGYEGFR